MPNRKTHDTIGAIAGGSAALWQARDEELFGLVLETLGGVLAGKFASRLPDVFDPPTSPNHRGLGHGVLPNGWGLTLGVKCVSELQTSLRDEATKFARLQAEATTAPEATAYLLLEILYRLAAGAVPGALAGYGSHLILDARTKKGLPFVA